MDRRLVEAAKRGDRDAFTELMRPLGDRLYALAFRILRDQHLAQDAFQEGSLLAWRQLPSLRDPDRFEAWIHRIVIRACYTESRKRARWTANVRELDVESDGLSDTPPAIHDRERLERAFETLTVDHRAIFVLHHYSGFPLIEIARLLGIPPGTARSRLHYATQALRFAVGADEAQAALKERLA